MKKPKLYVLILCQIIMVSMVVLVSTSYTLDQVPLLNSKYTNSKISISGIPIISWDANGIVTCDFTAEQEWPRICSDGAGGVIIAWNDYRSTSDWDVYAQRFDSNGVAKWTTNGKAISTPGSGNQYEVEICSDGSGGAIICWYDGRDSITLGSDIYAQKVDSNGDPQWTVNGIPICNQSDNQDYPDICSDGAGGAIITWIDDRAGASNGNVYAQWVDSNGDLKWDVNGTLVCNASNQQKFTMNYGPNICSDGAGGAIITWIDERLGSTSDNIYAQRINSSGQAHWTANGVPICINNTAQNEPRICSDGAGGAIIVWEDPRNGGAANFDIYAQRIDSTGQIRWIANGTPICNYTDGQEDPNICSDEAGGAIITWVDDRDNVNDVYAQKMNSEGVEQWTLNGTAIRKKTVSGTSLPVICSDGYGGAFIVYRDYNATEFCSDVYLQCINSNGEIQDSLNGTLICG
ncbi:MAG: hypothetical protein ACFFDN_33140, partial [Candidatus Hodarchaeota archaeon]